MRVKIIEGELTDRIRRACYAYLVEKYRREKLQDGGDLRSSLDRRIRSTGIQHTGPDPRVPEKGGNGRSDRIYRRGDFGGVSGSSRTDQTPGGRAEGSDHEGGVSRSGSPESKADEPIDRDRGV